MSPRKELHDWINSNYFRKSDIKRIGALYLVTFGDSLSKPLQYTSDQGGITYNQFRSKMASLGLIELTKIEIKKMEEELCEKAKEYLDRISIRSELTVPHIRLDKNDCAKCKIVLNPYYHFSEDIQKEFSDFFSPTPKPYQPKEGEIVKFMGKMSGSDHIIVYRNEKIKYGKYIGYEGFVINGTWDLVTIPIGQTTEPLSPVTEEEREQFHTELEKLGKWLNPETHLIEDDKRIDIDKIDLADCIAKKDLTPYFPTKQLQDMALGLHEDNRHNCKENNLLEKFYKGNKYNCNKISCKDCPFKSDNRDLMLSMKPFAKELTDKEKFEEWKKSQGNLPEIVTNGCAPNLHWKLWAIKELFLCAKYLNEGWVPDWNDKEEYKYVLCNNNGTISIDYWSTVESTLIAFKTSDLAQKAIEILGEDLIRQALSNDY